MRTLLGMLTAFFATVLFMLQEPISKRLGIKSSAENPHMRWWLGAIDGEGR